MNRKNDAGGQGPQNPAEKPAASPRLRPVLAALRKREGARREREQGLTTSDLAVLSLLAEQPMYGYQANMELKRREIWDWAEVSQPQLYYSLEKLARLGLLRKLDPREPKARFDRDTFETTEQGREALADTLEREEWTTQRDRPAFLTWMAISWLARPGVFRTQLKKRRKFLLKELKREKATLMSILGEVGHRFHEAVWMVSLMMDQLKTEIRWNRQLEQDLKRRARALHPSVFTENLPK
ncbi:MAG TPA: PadR family transcriptional regulator [Candidatus Acidoferrum sp.]